MLYSKRCVLTVVKSSRQAVLFFPWTVTLTQSCTPSRSTLVTNIANKNSFKDKQNGNASSAHEFNSVCLFHVFLTRCSWLFQEYKIPYEPYYYLTILGSLSVAAVHKFWMSKVWRRNGSNKQEKINAVASWAAVVLLTKRQQLATAEQRIPPLKLLEQSAGRAARSRQRFSSGQDKRRHKWTQ